MMDDELTRKRDFRQLVRTDDTRSRVQRNESLKARNSNSSDSSFGFGEYIAA